MDSKILFGESISILIMEKLKNQLSSFDIAALVKEFSILIGSYIDKIYQTLSGEVVIRINTKSGRKYLFIDPAGWIFIARREKKLEIPEKATNFAMCLRKYLAGGKIAEIKQEGFDRIVELEISQKGKKHFLVAELFSKGNIILLNEQREIILPLSKQAWRHRTIKPGAEYIYPPCKPNPAKISLTELRAVLEKAKKDILRTLVLELYLPGIYAEEACLNADINPDAEPKSLTDGQIESIHSAMMKLFKAEKNPTIIVINRNPADAVPMKLNLYSDYETKVFNCFNDAVEEFYWCLKDAKEKEKKRSLVEKKRTQLESLLLRQKEALEKFQTEIRECKKAGDLISEHHLEVDECIRKVSQKVDMNSIRELVEIDEKSNCIEMRIENEKIKLDLKENAFENASDYYNAYKKAKAKLESAEKAVSKTLDKIKALNENFGVESKKEKERGLWFEKYRWFFSSDNILIIAGRDAKSNDEIVKKRLKSNDIYAHADIHGAPSTVIKGNSKTAINDGCEFSLIFSKAWNEKIASGDAYWVLPEQVSKRAPAGEYIPKGAFIITGKKNYVRNIQIQAGIGLVKIDTSESPSATLEKLMCGPVSAIKSKSDKYVIFAPGNMKKEDFAKKLSSAFSVSLDIIMRILPPGNVRVIESKNIKL